jgi:addiction module HigA family antidote
MVESFIDDLGVSQISVARALGITKNRLNEIVKNKRGITADSALRFSAYFGTTAQFWMNLQTSWDLWQELKNGANVYTTIRQHRHRAVRKAAADAATVA